MLSVDEITEILLCTTNRTSTAFTSADRFNSLVACIAKTNQQLWDLEDSARMIELGPEHVSKDKQAIDKANQKRNDYIREIDTEVCAQLNVRPLGSVELFYSESPGMIIDRLSILYIKLSVIHELLSVIKTDSLKTEYRNKQKGISMQVKRLSRFLDLYLVKLLKKEAYFETQQAIKIYNDKRIRRYIKLLQKAKSAHIKHSDFKRK